MRLQTYMIIDGERYTTGRREVKVTTMDKVWYNFSFDRPTEVYCPVGGILSEVGILLEDEIAVAVWGDEIRTRKGDKIFVQPTEEESMH